MLERERPNSCREVEDLFSDATVLGEADEQVEDPLVLVFFDVCEEAIEGFPRHELALEVCSDRYGGEGVIGEYLDQQFEVVFDFLERVFREVAHQVAETLADRRVHVEHLAEVYVLVCADRQVYVERRAGDSLLTAAGRTARSRRSSL